MDKVKVYLAMKNADMTEGRGPMVIHAIFSDRSVAETFIDTQPGVMGRTAKWSEENSGGDWKVKEYPVYHSIDDLLHKELGEAHTSALRKLTDKEIEAIKVLGI